MEKQAKTPHEIFISQIQIPSIPLRLQDLQKTLSKQFVNKPNTEKTRKEATDFIRNWVSRYRYENNLSDEVYKDLEEFLIHTFYIT